eukprot:1154239-Pelagomonas_calceolata.AAC.10
MALMPCMVADCETISGVPIRHAVIPGAPVSGVHAMLGNLTQTGHALCATSQLGRVVSAAGDQ